MDAQHLITTKPKADLCQGCGHLLLTGHGNGLAYRVEADPITHTAEVAAVLDRIETYDLRYGAITLRIASDMQAAQPSNTPVLITHSCRRPLPDTHRANHPPDPFAAALHAIRQQLDVTVDPPY